MLLKKIKNINVFRENCSIQFTLLFALLANKNSQSIAQIGNFVFGFSENVDDHRRAATLDQIHLVGSGAVVALDKLNPRRRLGDPDFFPRGF